jgi:hypothetical protein
LRRVWRPLRGYLLLDLPNLQAAVPLWLHWRGKFCCWRWIRSSVPMWFVQWLDRRNEIWWGFLRLVVSTHCPSLWFSW